VGFRQAAHVASAKGRGVEPHKRNRIAEEGVGGNDAKRVTPRFIGLGHQWRLKFDFFFVVGAHEISAPPQLDTRLVAHARKDAKFC
jgi:hypothetical protein